MDVTKTEHPPLNRETSHQQAKKKRSEFYEKQSKIFQNVLAHVDEEVRTQMDKVCCTDHLRVLMIYTGGTIGMINTEKGYTIKKGFLNQSIKANKYLCDTGYTYFNGKDDFMITPLSIYKRRIWFKLHEFDHIRDSSTFDTEDWVNIASMIEKEYDNYDAFIILHGTDTMAFTASALSFMLENLKKTVVLTGSQVPLSEMRNDAFDNILGAITIAGHFTIPEVMIFFKDKLYRGNRSTKSDTFGLDAFTSPNLAPLGTFGFYFKLDWSLIRKSTSYQKLHVQKNLNKKIGVLKMFPMIPVEIIQSVLSSSIEACIIEAYGAGNLPIDRPEIAAALRKACENGKIVVITSQCGKGTVNTIYAIGKQVKELGIVSGLDMTLECTVAKLSYLLGKGITREEIIDCMQTDMRGELTPLVPPSFHEHQGTFISAIADALTVGSDNEALKNAVFPTIMCYAADFGYINILQELKNNGANLEVGDYEGRTPLHIAARKGHIEVINHLIQEGVSIDAIDKNGKSALYEAIVCKRWEAAKVLVHAHAKVLAEHNDLSDYLFRTVVKGDLETLRFFYHAGVKDLGGFLNVDKRSLAHIAVAENQYKIVEFMKEEVDLNFNVKDRWNRTPLDEAKALNNAELLNLLIGTRE